MKKLTLTIIFGLLAITSIHAKWASTANAPTKVSSKTEIIINEDGTSKTIQEITTEILNEVGRNAHSNKTLTYTGDNEEMEILEAKTIYQNKSFPINKNLIEDKPLASSPSGFDQFRQILLAFPNVRIGSKIYLKVKRNLINPPLKNFYAKTFYFGDTFIHKAEIKIKSKLPLYVSINDPEKNLKITENKTKDINTIEISLIKPIYKTVTNETRNIILNPKHIPYVSISSLKNWEEFAKQQNQRISKVLTQKLPKSFENILNKAKKKKTSIEQINTVTSILNEKIKYMGDWRTVAGRYVPRDLAEISTSQLGDCKDFSAATIAILNKLGFNAKVALVRRGVGTLSLNILPSFDAFNHMMTKITDPKGQIYWIDPTNFVSMASGIFPDIADKKALVIDPENPSYEKIPAVNYQHAKTKIQKQLYVLPNNKTIVSGSLTLINEDAIGLTGSELQASKKTIEDSILSYLAGYTLDENTPKSIELPSLTSRIVKNLTFKYKLEKEGDILTTNAGPALKIPYGETIASIYNISQDNVADVVVGPFPNTINTKTIIKNIKVKNISSLNKEINTPWIYLKRTYKSKRNGDVQIDYTGILYKNIIPSEDFKKPEFIKLKNWLKNNFKDAIIVFEYK